MTAMPLGWALHADTDQGFAQMRDIRAGIVPDSPEGQAVLLIAGKLAEVIRSEFPGVPVARAVMAVVLSLRAIADENGEHGFADSDLLLGVAGLAAEQLGREEAQSPPASAKMTFTAHLCPSCGGYEPNTGVGADAGLPGRCDGCHQVRPQLHRFVLTITPGTPCGCHGHHDRVVAS